MPTFSPIGWVWHSNSATGLSIATPKSWTYRDEHISGPISPAPELAVGTWNFPSGGNCAPTKALMSVPLGGVFFYLYETTSPDPPFPPRPAHFRLGAIGGPFECLGVKTYVIHFDEGQRAFTVHVEFGRTAQTSKELKEEVKRSLDTLVVTKPG